MKSKYKDGIKSVLGFFEFLETNFSNNSRKNKTENPSSPYPRALY
jgi:hypothetical protein